MLRRCPAPRKDFRLNGKRPGFPGRFRLQQRYVSASELVAEAQLQRPLRDTDVEAVCVVVGHRRQVSTAEVVDVLAGRRIDALEENRAAVAVTRVGRETACC